MAISQTDSSGPAARRPAVFLDRDNTLIEDPGYIDHPDKVRLLPGAAAAVRRLRDAGFRVIVVSNQSGIARGLFTEERLAQVHGRLNELLASDGAALDAIYYCPYLDGPEATVARYRQASELRKPAPGMLLKAAAELNLDLARSWMVGDEPRDIEAGRRAGCRTVLIDFRIADARDHGHHIAGEVDSCAGSLEAAADVILGADSMDESSRTDQAEPAREIPSSSTDSESRQTGPVENRNSEVSLLREIRDLLNRQQRLSRQTDFSFLRLLASLLQMLALTAAVAGILSLLSDREGAATARFSLAAFLQLATLTAYVLERDRR